MAEAVRGASLTLPQPVHIAQANPKVEVKTKQSKVKQVEHKRKQSKVKQSKVKQSKLGLFCCFFPKVKLNLA